MISTVRQAKLYRELANYNSKVAQNITWDQHPDNRDDRPGNDFYDVMHTYWGPPEDAEFRPIQINLEDVNYDRDNLGDYASHDEFYNDRGLDSPRIQHWQQHFDQHGSLPPSTVIKDEDGKWVLLDGSHRADVAWRNGLRTHPAYELVNKDPSIMNDHNRWFEDSGSENENYRHSSWKLAEQSPEESQGLRGWPKIMAKAQRLRNEGRVLIQTNTQQYVAGQVEGDHDLYNPQLWRENAENQKISAWQCTCPWFQYAFGRTRKWKKYEGRPCAHLLALYWEGLTQPFTDEIAPEEQPLEEEQTQEIAPNYQQIPGTLPEVSESETPPGTPAINLLNPNTQRVTRTIKDALKYMQYSGGQC